MPISNAGSIPASNSEFLSFNLAAHLLGPELSSNIDHLRSLWREGSSANLPSVTNDVMNDRFGN
jgi:hypothetical protein